MVKECFLRYKGKKRLGIYRRIIRNRKIHQPPAISTSNWIWRKERGVGMEKILFKNWDVYGE